MYYTSLTFIALVSPFIAVVKYWQKQLTLGSVYLGFRLHMIRFKDVGCAPYGSVVKWGEHIIESLYLTVDRKKREGKNFKGMPLVIYFLWLVATSQILLLPGVQIFNTQNCGECFLFQPQLGPLSRWSVFKPWAWFWRALLLVLNFCSEVYLFALLFFS